MVLAVAVGVGGHGAALAAQGEPGEHGGTGAQGHRSGGAARGEIFSGTAFVESIDRQNRKVTLRNSEGDRVTVSVPQERRGFDQLKVGDRLDIGYVSSVAVAIDEAGKGTKMREQTELQRTDPSKPGGVSTRQVMATVQITNIDHAQNKVTFKGPRGMTHTVTVKDPQIQQRLKDMKVGDMVDVTYTEALAIQVTPQGKQGGQQAPVEKTPPPQQ